MPTPAPAITAEHLLADHPAALRNYLGARCRDHELTAELMQEVAARLVLATPRLRLNGNARGYLFRIAASVWHDHLRREMVRRRSAMLVQANQPALAPAADARLLERELRTPCAERSARCLLRSGKSWSCDNSGT